MKIEEICSILNETFFQEEEEKTALPHPVVDNDYIGFDVKASWEWSKKWLSTLRETADGNSKEAWEAQLHKFNLS